MKRSCILWATLVSSEAMLGSLLTVLLCNLLVHIRTKSNRKWSSAMCKFWYIHSDIRGVLSTVVCIVTHHREEGRETFLYIKSTEILPVCLVDFCRIANFHRTYDHHPIQSKTILPNFPKIMKEWVSLWRLFSTIEPMRVKSSNLKKAKRLKEYTIDRWEKYW